MAEISVYAHARAATPGAVDDLPWDDLAREIAEHANELTRAPATADADAQKRALVAIAPHVLREGATRSVANVERVTLLVLDVDAGEPAAVAERLRAHGWAGLVYASPSDTPEARRFRVVSPIAEPIPPDACAGTRVAFAEALGLAPGCGVEACLDPSRIFFMGRLHGTPERETINVAGSPVDAASLPAPRLAWRAGPAERAPSAPLAELPPADAGIAAALGDWRAHDGHKHDLCGAVGGLMRKLGFSAAECEAEVRAWLDGAATEGVDVDAGAAWACAAWAKHEDEVSGAAALGALLGAEHGAVVERAALASSAIGRSLARRPKESEPWRPAVAADSAAPLGRACSFLSPDEPVDYWCPGLRLAPSDGKISLIAGLPNAGKGPIANALAIAFATGGKVFGVHQCARKRVLLFDAEGARLTMRRLRRLARGARIDPRALAGALDVFDVSAVDLLGAAFHDALAAMRPEVVILDSYTSAMLATGVDSFKPEFATLAKALGALGVLVIAVAHATKAPAPGERPTLQQVSGSGALGAMAQTAIVAWKSAADAAPNRVSIACMRAPETGFEAFDIEFRDEPGDALAVRALTQAEAAKDETAALRERHETLAARVLAALHSVAPMPKTASAIAGIIGANKQNVGASLASLERAGIVVRQADANARSEGAVVLRDPSSAPKRVVCDARGDVVPGDAPAPAVAGFVRGKRG